MLSWLRRIFGGPGYWPASQRRIFGYHDGTGRKWADPLVLHRQLAAEGGEGWQDLFTPIRVAWKMPAGAGSEAIRRHAEEASQEAARKLAALARKVFGLPPLSDDGRGLTEAEALGVLQQYLGFVAALVEESRPLASWRGPTGSPPASGSTTAASAASPSPSPTAGGATPPPNLPTPSAG